MRKSDLDWLVPMILNSKEIESDEELKKELLQNEVAISYIEERNRVIKEKLKII